MLWKLPSYIVVTLLTVILVAVPFIIVQGKVTVPVAIPVPLAITSYEPTSVAVVSPDSSTSKESPPFSVNAAGRVICS